MTVRFELPDELYHQAVAAAARLGITLDEFIALSLERHIALCDERTAAAGGHESR